MVLMHNEYLEWLKARINIGDRVVRYSLVLSDLHRFTFLYSVPNDENRAADGSELREKFCDEMEIRYKDSYFNFPVTMLEMLVALAERCEFVTYGGDNSLDVAEWFWLLLENCGLSDYHDDAYYDYLETTRDVVERIMKRTYSRKGVGGLFPVTLSRKDFRKMELWYQMNTYISENFA